MARVHRRTNGSRRTMAPLSRFAGISLEPLEPRMMLSASWTIRGDDAGPDAADVIVLRNSAADAGVIEALVNGQLVGSRARADLKAINVLAGDGDDVVRVEIVDNSASKPLRIKVHGGAGDDLIYGGDVAALLIGGAGNDTLRGGNGDERIEGKGGRDTISGGLGSDRLIGGGGRRAGNTIHAQPGIDTVVAAAGDLLLRELQGDELQQRDSEASFQQWFVDAAVRQWQDLLGNDSQHQGWRPGGIDDRNFIAVPSVFGEGQFTLLATSDAAANYSTTNVQEAGVDEADIVKTDGQHIYAIINGEVVVINSSIEAFEEIARPDIEGEAFDLYLIGDRLTVLSWEQVDVIYPLDDILVPLADGASFSEEIATSRLIRWQPPKLVLTVLDVTDAQSPVEVERTVLEGSLVASRAVGDRVIVVMQNPLVSPMPIVLPQGDGSDLFEDEATFRARLKASMDTLPLPSYTTTTWQDGEAVESTGSLLNAPMFYAPDDATGEALITLVAFDVADDDAGPSTTTSTAGVSDQVYVSTESLYLAVSTWAPLVSERWTWDATTQLVQFDLTNDDMPLVASGAVAGYPLNQFSMSEHEGRLRIATTSTAEGLSNNLFILERQGDELVTAGAITDLALTERIYAARFVGDRAFLVTFRQIDPLFTLDLSDPTNPKVVGELKIPGFSSYLHPLSADRILGFGRDADPVTGRTTGLQLSLFDVSDFANPVRLSVVDLDEPGASSSSEAEWDHHAFALFQDEGLVALPVSQYSSEGVTHALELYGISDEGIDSAASVAHKTPVRRSLRIGEYLYSLSQDEIKLSPIADPEDVLATLDL